MQRKTFIGACDTCGTLSAVPRGVAKPLIDAVPAGTIDTAVIAVAACSQVVKAPTTPATKCSGTIHLVGIVMMLPHDIPYGDTVG